MKTHICAGALQTAGGAVVLTAALLGPVTASAQEADSSAARQTGNGEQQVAAAAAPAPSLNFSSHNIAAVVNDEIITNYDVEQRLRLITTSTRSQPDEATLNRLRQQVLRSLVDERLKLQEAAEFEVRISREQVDTSINRIAARNNLTMEQFQAQMDSLGIDLTTLEVTTMADIAWSNLVRGRFGPRISVTDEEAENMMERMKAVADQPRYQVAEIVLPVDSPELGPEVERLAAGLLEQMEQGVSFQTLAQNFSQSASSANGGNIGWVHEGELAPELNDILVRLRPGQVSRPIRTPGGYTILALLDRQIADSANLDEVDFTLKQLVIPVPPTAANEMLKQAALFSFQVSSAVRGCESVEQIAAQSPALQATDVGTVKYSMLSPNFQEAVSDLTKGEASPPVRSETGFHVLVVCDRQGDEIVLPEMEELKDQIFSEQMEIQSRRWLRDIRRDATIEYRM